MTRGRLGLGDNWISMMDDVLVTVFDERWMIDSE